MEYRVPCISCNGKGHWQDSLGYEIYDCVFCCCQGYHEVSKIEYDEFWTHFTEDDFK